MIRYEYAHVCLHKYMHTHMHACIAAYRHNCIHTHTGDDPAVSCGLHSRFWHLMINCDTSSTTTHRIRHPTAEQATRSIVLGQAKWHPNVAPSAEIEHPAKARRCSSAKKSKSRTLRKRDGAQTRAGARVPGKGQSWHARSEDLRMETPPARRCCGWSSSNYMHTHTGDDPAVSCGLRSPGI